MQTIERTFAVLRAIAESDESVGVSEIARRAGLAKSTTSRILVSLDEDPSLRLAGNLVASPDGEIDEVDPASIEIGEPVRVVFTRLEDVHVPRWMRPEDP